VTTESSYFGLQRKSLGVCNWFQNDMGPRRSGSSRMAFESLKIGGIWAFGDDFNGFFSILISC